LRLATGALQRTRDTIPQVGLSVSARRKNVRGVFSVRRPQDVRNRTVVVIDDVMTTGATLSACAAALKRAGAARVLGLSLARATPQFPDTGTPDLTDLTSPIDELGQARHNGQEAVRSTESAG
jgi:adenine/guanine phosphoribosyltransferase-like PRPP-binding protein